MSDTPTEQPFAEGFETKAIHQGQGFNGGTGSVIPPAYLTSTFAHGNEEGFDYTRSGNPNFRNLGAMLASLEDAEHATVFGSGVSAITAVVSTLKSGDVVVAEENIYGCTYRLFAQVFEKFGVTVQYTDLTDPSNYDVIDSARPALVWLESPTNPLLKIVDIEAISERAHAVDAQVVVDNTFASSYFQKPIALGADVSLTSTTKYTNGHSDSLGGVVVTNSGDWQGKMTFAQKALGLQPAPFDCWLISRGAKTMGVRMEQHQKNALALATYLESHEKVEWVRYPFLESHPQYALAKRQMTGGSGIVTANFTMNLEDTRAFLNRLEYFTLAESLGGVESLICHPASMTHASIPKDVRESVGIRDSLVRFSVGIELIDDLIRDVEKTLG
ncbi:MAG: PLP-dependent aspartate aminotransferase family protein [Candidatus Hydrogenedentota bacterium]